MTKVNLEDGFARSLISKNKIKSVSGFTLIELLVVMGILALLVSIIWPQLAQSILKGKDAAIKEDLRSVQNQAGIEFLNLDRKFNNTGTPISAGPGGSTAADCATLSTAGTLFANSQIQTAIADVKSQNGGIAVTCNVTGLAYAIVAAMRTTGTFWCVDSTGAARGTSLVYSGTSYNNQMGGGAAALDSVNDYTCN